MAFGRKVFPIDSSKPQHHPIILDTFLKCLRATWNYWNRLQIGHRERYSVERLLSFRDYCQRTSSTRVVVVSILALVPAFVVAILVECIPLQSPAKGWRANYAFWIRLFVSSLPIAFGGVYQVKEVIEPGVISTKGIVATAVGSCACYVVFTLGVAAVWKFPIPFGYVLTIGPFVMFYVVFFLLSIGPRILTSSPALRQQIFAQMLVISAQGILAIAYPTFGAIFNQLSGNGQAAFIFVLPVIKFTIKQFIAKVAAHLQECVGPIVVLSVDVCNVLYVTICMQTAISPLTTSLVIATDAFFIVLALRSIYSADMTRPRPKNLQLSSLKENYLDDLIQSIDNIFRSSVISSSAIPIRTRAPFPLPLSKESAAFMNELVRSKRKGSGKVTHFGGSGVFSIAPTDFAPRRMSADNQVEKAINDSSPAFVSKIARNFPGHHRIADYELLRRASAVLLASRSSRRRSSVDVVAADLRRVSSAPQVRNLPRRGEDIRDVQDALQALFHSEYIVMTEFVECAIPMLYAVYLAVLYHLPTAAYYPHTRSLTAAKFASTELSLVTYAMVEFGSFLGMHLMLKMKFGFSPLYQLAFVIETQVRTIQGHLFVWILCILQITLVHNGAYCSRRYSSFTLGFMDVWATVSVAGVDLDAPFK